MNKRNFSCLKHLRKSFVCIVFTLAFSLFLGSMPPIAPRTYAVGTAASTADVVSMLASWKSKLNQKYWNYYDRSQWDSKRDDVQSNLKAVVDNGYLDEENPTNAQLGVTTSPCSGTDYAHGCRSNYFSGGWQCYGFAWFIEYALFRSTYEFNPGDWYAYSGSDLDSISLQPGDLVRVSNHSIVVGDVSGGVLNCVECWGGSGCKISWSPGFNWDQYKTPSAMLTACKNGNGTVYRYRGISGGTVPASKYFLNVNGYLDGKLKDGTNGYGTFDVYINGKLDANDATDYYKQWPEGTDYEITDIKTARGKTYAGLWEGKALAGKIAGYTEINLKLNTEAGTSVGTGYVMTAEEFINCLKIALGRKTGYWSKYPYDLGYYDGETIFWDCSNLGKSIIWSGGAIVNNYTVGNYQRVDTSCGLGDWKTVELYEKAPDPSGDFSSIVPGEWLYMSGHIGYYIGNGQVIECTTGWNANGVIQSQIDRDGNRIKDGADGGAWIAHWKSPWIDYANQSPDAGAAPLKRYYLNVNGVLDGALEDGTNGYGAFDVYINGKLDANDATDYYKQWPEGTSYEIKDVKAADGHSYDGLWQSKPLSGTVGGYTEINLVFNSIVSVTSAFLADGVYTLTPMCAPGSQLDVFGGASENGGNVVIYASHSHRSQQFQITRLSNGYYTIAVAGTELVLDMENGGSTAGTNIQLWEANGTDAQQWAFVDCGGCYSIVPKLNAGLRVDVDYALSDDNTNVKVWDDNGTDAQLWRIEPIRNIGIHFPVVKSYTNGMFSDVPANQWYTNEVARAYEYGLMVGNSKTSFNPYGDVTIAEAITMAARIHNKYTNGTDQFSATGANWFDPYKDYAYINDIIDFDMYTCDVSQKATRAEFAEIFANALPESALAPINNVSDNSIPDIPLSASCSVFVYRLYRAGILVGSDANGTFYPQTFITRAEAAAIVSRMAESGNRKTITLV